MTAETPAPSRADSAAPTASQARSAWSRRIFDVVSRYGFVIVFFAFAVFFALRADAFLNPSNLVNILEGNAVLLIAALAMTLVVASGGIDLSIGIAIDFGGWFAIIAMRDYDLTWASALLVGVLAGAAVGVLNAGLIVRLKISPFLATLGTFFIGSSIQQIYTSGGGQVPFREMSESFRSLSTGAVLGVPTEIVIAAVVGVVYFVLLERSVHGKRIHAIGLQRSVASVSGIRVSGYLVFVFVFASATVALSGIILTAGLRQFTPLSGFSYLLDAIAAVFIGASMHPQRRPNVAGTLLGVLFLGVVSNGLNLMGLDFNLRDALEGIILVGALALAFANRNNRARAVSI
ncbi:MAG: ABC transporter permease [Acidimicrobiaceae bacterium]|nr:ABC transporter permease [Acidimicrobiaceae bacterium]MCY4281157.1 ABC transporter permease [Acidimicrobiaceae bacterium]MCY4294382.1 ABC transporter permease [Acidimicrobiaceae bacterium]